MGSAVRRRTLLAWLAASFGGAASAQAAFPSRPLRIVVPSAAGGAADITARTLGQKIAGPLGQSVVIDNKPSAGGVVAGEQVARAEPDGHTLLLVSSGTAVSAALFQSLPFDTLKDFAPVSLLATFDLAVVVKEGGRLRRQRDLAYELITAIPGVSCVKPQAALYMFPRLDPTIYPIADDRQFFLEVLKETKVMLVQGTGFNYPDTQHFRLVFLPHEDDLRVAIGRLAKFLEGARRRFGTEGLV